jgi:hypothetical protein
LQARQPLYCSKDGVLVQNLRHFTKKTPQSIFQDASEL